MLENRSKIRSLEDLEVWQEARALGIWAIKIVKKLPDEERFSLKKHMRENLRNIPANIGEGFYRYHFKEKAQFYDVSLGCLGELKSDFYVCFDREYISREILSEATDKIETLIKRLNRMITTTIFQINNPKNSNY